MNTRHAVIVLLLAATASAGLVAQDTAPPRLSFEVAAIKRNVSLDAGGSLGMLPGGRFRTVNVDVRSLIAFAYRMQPRSLFPSQIIGAPDWLASDRYDITAKISAELVARAPSDPLQTPKVVRSLLEDRFKLEAHRELKELDVFDLVPAKRDRLLGPGMRVSTVDCEKERSKCGLRFSGGQLSVTGITLETLCSLLSSAVGRLVVDHTGLTGKFDVEAEWAPDQPASDKPSIFTALQEQLGLKLAQSREPVDVVVIDHVERPTED